MNTELGGRKRRRPEEFNTGEMFDSPTLEFDFEPVWDTHEPEKINTDAILAQCRGLPAAVCQIDPTCEQERILTEEELDRLTNPFSAKLDDTEQQYRLMTRRQALEPHLGSLLMCVYARFPGAHYTIEIDPVTQAVIHWEWQKT